MRLVMRTFNQNEKDSEEKNIHHRPTSLINALIVPVCQRFAQTNVGALFNSNDSVASPSLISVTRTCDVFLG